MKFKIGRANFISLFLSLSLICIGCARNLDQYDIFIKNTKIVDGTGNAAFSGNIAIKGDKIVALGNIKGEADIVIDGSGFITCPGFIDSHSHADQTILQYPNAENFIMQGVTTVLCGNCGFSPSPTKEQTFSQWASDVEGTGISINLAELVGHASIRHVVMGDDFRRQATQEEIEQMKAFVEEAMRSGAFGLSTTLEPSVAELATTEEIVELAKIAQKYGGIYSPHTRHMQNHWWTDNPKDYSYDLSHSPIGEVIVGRYHGVLEAIEISKKAKNIPLLIAHFFPVYITPQPIPEFLQAALAKATLTDIIDKARESSLNVYCNLILPGQHLWEGRVPIINSFYNPTSGHTIKAPPPAWLKQIKKLTKEEFAEKLKTRGFREELKQIIYSGRFKFGMIHPLTDPYWMDCFTVLTCKNKIYEGKTIGELARKRSNDDIINAVYNESVEVVFDILSEDTEATWIQSYEKRSYDAAVAEFFKHSSATLGIDCNSLPANPGQNSFGISPGFYGTFPFYIRKFVKETKILSLEEAIKKASYVAAHEILGLNDRGILAPDAYADVLIFNLDTINMVGDYMNPAQPPEGIEFVLVNGKIVYTNKSHTGERPGIVIKHEF